MSFVDFKISSIKEVTSITQDNVVEVKAYMYSGHYEDAIDELTNEVVNTYTRDAKFGDVLIIFVPKTATESEINKELYQLLLEYKDATDEVIPECIF